MKKKQTERQVKRTVQLAQDLHEAAQRLPVPVRANGFRGWNALGAVVGLTKRNGTVKVTTLAQ